MGQLPNILSLFRLLAAPAVGWLIVNSRFGAALALGLPAAISDWLDGYLARLLDAKSRIGIYLDPAADKVLLVTAFLCLGWMDKIPHWLVGLVIGRDVVIVVGAWLLWQFKGRTRFAPLYLGKVSTAFQIVTVLAALLLGAQATPAWYFLWLVGVLGTTLFTVWSGLAYVRKGIRMISREDVVD